MQHRTFDSPWGTTRTTNCVYIYIHTCMPVKNISIRCYTYTYQYNIHIYVYIYIYIYIYICDHEGTLLACNITITINHVINIGLRTCKPTAATNLPGALVTSICPNELSQQSTSKDDQDVTKHKVVLLGFNLDVP